MKDRKREIRWMDKLKRKVEMAYSILVLEAAQFTRCNEPRFSIPVFYTPIIEVENGDWKTGFGPLSHFHEFEQEVCRRAKKLTSGQFLTIRLLISSAHYYSWGIPKKSSRPLRRPLRIIKKLLRTITTCQKLNKMPPRNSQDAVKNCQHNAAYSYKYLKAGLELQFLFLQE